MPYFTDILKVSPVEIVPGVRIRTLWGDKVMMSLIETDPHTDVPEHTHPHEQAGMVLEGEFDMTIGGERQTLKRGTSYVIPGGRSSRPARRAGQGPRARHLLPTARGLQGAHRRGHHARMGDDGGVGE